jgi:hypothetical protein
MLLHINGNFTMRKMKSSLLSRSFVINRSWSISRCRSRYGAYLAVSVLLIVHIYISLEHNQYITPIVSRIMYSKIYGRIHRGSQLYFHIARYMLKEKGLRTLFLLPKVKVEFRHLFSLQKRFSLCSYHNINANIVVFCWLTGLQWNNTRF